MNPNADAADLFHRLHRGPEILVLANAWDAGSAKLIESVGAAAIATTSAGVAWSHGYPDGNALPLELLLASVKDIVRAIKVPLTVDFEGGYAPDPAGVGLAVARLIDAGGVGINIEDGSDPPDALCARIEQAKAAAARSGVNLFVNARTDVYLRGLTPEPMRVGETLARAARYRDAGADGIFAAGISDPNEIAEVAEGVGLPLNVLARAGLPPAAELKALGVRRLSAGSGITQAVWGRMSVLARDFLRDGRSEPLGEGAMVFPQINALLHGG